MLQPFPRNILSCVSHLSSLLTDMGSLLVHELKNSTAASWRTPLATHSTERGGLGSFAETEAAKPRGSAVPQLQDPNSGSVLLHLRLQFL